MKMNRDSDALAARLAAAGNQPPVVLAFSPKTVEPKGSAAPSSEAEEKAAFPVEQPKRKKERKARINRAALDDDAVPISLRPSRELLTRYVVAASERTRESGRVVSAQQMMIEVLERGL